MKKLFILLSIVGSLYAQAQTDTTGLIRFGGHVLRYDSIWGTGGRIVSFYIDTTVGKNDTVGVVMLITDTSDLKFNGRLLLDIDRYVHVQYEVHLQYGYEVIIHETYSEIPNPDYWGDGRSCLVDGCTLDHSSRTIKKIIHPSVIIYLDDNKKPLSKNIVVWMDKKL